MNQWQLTISTGIAFQDHSFFNVCRFATYRRSSLSRWVPWRRSLVYLRCCWHCFCNFHRETLSSIKHKKRGVTESFLVCSFLISWLERDWVFIHGAPDLETTRQFRHIEIKWVSMRCSAKSSDSHLARRHKSLVFMLNEYLSFGLTGYSDIFNHYT